MQLLTQFLAHFTAILVFVPLSFLAIRMAMGTSARLKWGMVIVAVSFLLFCFGRRHQDLYRGLDSMMYGNLAKAFRSGVPMLHVDSFFASIPDDAAKPFLFWKSSFRAKSRHSHDKTFVITADGVSRPWFMVMHSLVASALPDGLFVPLLGAFWLAILFAACCRGTGPGGICVFLVGLFASPYPFWFFRDEFAEVAGATLVASALLSHSVKPLKRPLEFAAAAFLLGFAVAFHRSTLLFSLPVATILFVDAGSARNRTAVLLAFCIGISALYLETRLVSAPYGDWTQVMPAGGEGGGAGGTGKESQGLKLLGKYSQYLSPQATEYFLTGLAPALKSLGVLMAVFFLAGSVAVFRKKQSNFAWKAFPVVLLWLLLPCINRLGHDGYHGSIVGIWNFRRIFPFALVSVSLFARPLSEWLDGVLSRKWRVAEKMPVRYRNALAVSAAVLLCVFGVERNPTAYFAVEGKGCREIADETMAELERLQPDLVIFDYFLHHLPFVFNGHFDVLGISDKALENWGAAEEWLANEAKTRRVVVVSAWPSPPAEKGLVFKAMHRINRQYEGVDSKSFMDAAVVQRGIVNTILLAQSQDDKVFPSAPPPFSLAFDGHPLGMRGHWRAAPHGGMWSRPTSGFVGPLPCAGHPVKAVLELAWVPPDDEFPDREMTIECPGSSVTFTIGEGRTTNTLVFSSDDASPAGRVGEYHVSVKPPFNPAEYGTLGYPKDLGVVFHSAKLTPMKRLHATETPTAVSESAPAASAAP